MIVEQAFLKLPEVLTGSRFPSQEYEGGIVGAFSMALLQQLNGANLNSPLSAIQHERLYRKKNFWVGLSGKERHLRADLHLNLKGFRTASKGLSAYGWRHNNWLEAKFFRGSAINAQTKNTGLLLADLIRLLTLVPIERSKRYPNKTNSGRYLLHVYSGNPDDYLSPSQNVTGQGRVERRWLTPMLDYGRWHSCGYVDLNSEADGVLKVINRNMRRLQIKFECTNFVCEPISDTDERDFYCCILTRIDSFSVRKDGKVWTVRDDRTFWNQAHYKFISDFVGKHISVKETDNTPPSEQEVDQDLEEIGGGVEVGGEADADVVEAEAPVE